MTKQQLIERYRVEQRTGITLAGLPRVPRRDVRRGVLLLKDEPLEEITGDPPADTAPGSDAPRHSLRPGGS